MIHRYASGGVLSRVAAAAAPRGHGKPLALEPGALVVEHGELAVGFARDAAPVVYVAAREHTAPAERRPPHVTVSELGAHPCE